MTSLTTLVVVVLLVAIVAVTGLKPSGARPVSSTRLMHVARVALLVMLALVVYYATR